MCDRSPIVLVGIRHRVMRRWTIDLLATEHGCWAAAEPRPDELLADAIERSQPDLVLLDSVDFPECCRTALDAFPTERVIVIGPEPDGAYRRQALSRGAAGWISRDKVGEELRTIMRAALGCQHAPCPPAGRPRRRNRRPAGHRANSPEATTAHPRRAGPHQSPRPPLATRAEPFSRFARAHLRTTSQHAVYRTVGSDPSSPWTAAEIAAHTGVDEHEIGQALRSFTAAGILRDAMSSTGERQYQWRAEVRYVLEGTAPQAGEIDPVCGMPVEPDSRHIDRDEMGALVRFCSAFCRAAHRARTRRD